MKAIHYVLKKRKWQVAKLIFFLVLLGSYPVIFRTVDGFLHNRYAYSNIFYIVRLLFLALICILLVYVGFMFLIFVKEDWESLVLLGFNFPQRFILFFFTHYEILFLQVYFGTMIFQVEGRNIGPSLLVNISNSILIYMFGIWVSLHAHSKSLGFFTFAMMGFLGIVVGTKKISFNAVHTIVMSEAVTQILFVDCTFSVIIKIIIAMFLLLFLSYRYESICVEKVIIENRSDRRCITGDLIHWLNKHSVYGKNYVWMYRSKDFILWKIFSTILFLVFYCTNTSILVIFLLAYGIGMISSLYFKDIYNFETTLFHHYYMSNYAYTNFLRDLILSGFFLLGDNIFLVMLIGCFVNPQNIVILPVFAFTTLLVTIFVNSFLLVKYPMRQYYLCILLALVEFHVPVLNLYFLYKNICKGKRNWENNLI